MSRWCLSLWPILAWACSQTICPKFLTAFTGLKTLALSLVQKPPYDQKLAAGRIRLMALDPGRRRSYETVSAPAASGPKKIDDSRPPRGLRRVSEIAVQFKQPPLLLFRDNEECGAVAPSHASANLLVMRIQPNEGISLAFACKRPGTGIAPEQLDVIVGRKAQREIRRNELLSWDAV